MRYALFLIALSLILALSYIWIRRFETVRGVRYREEMRVRFDQRAEMLWTGLVEGGIPLEWRHYAKIAAHTTSHQAVRIAVETVRAIERPLARLSYKLRVTAPKGAGEVSEFLKTLSPEKRG